MVSSLASEGVRHDEVDRACGTPPLRRQLWIDGDVDIQDHPSGHMSTRLSTGDEGVDIRAHPFG